jgi:glutamate decarboxylase
MLSRKISPPKITQPDARPEAPYFREAFPEVEFPENGMPSYDAYRLIHDELSLDGNTALDLGSFTSTWMDPNAEKLIMENLGKNFIDYFEYQETKTIHDRVVNILARLFNVPEKNEFVGTATIGSSEAIELGLLAHKWRWKLRRKEQRKPTDHPNIVYCYDAHVCWDKFARYFDVCPRKVPIEEADAYPLDKIIEKVDENTICVGAVIGTTYSGICDPVEKLNNRLLEINENNCWDVGIHVDAASGGFILPFLEEEESFKWDFRLELVRTINASGHKFGLVYPGLGWLIFRDKCFLPEDLIFTASYLGADMDTYTLNFSRGAAMILAQYFNILYYGKQGYRQVMQHCCKNARLLANELKYSGLFHVISDLKLPIVTFEFIEEDPGFDPLTFSHRLRERNWMLPAYEMPKNLQGKMVMRVVVRESFNSRMIELLVHDMKEVYDDLSGKSVPKPKKSKGRKKVFYSRC